jgi:hypothetical protein
LLGSLLFPGLTLLLALWVIIFKACTQKSKTLQY